MTWESVSLKDLGTWYGGATPSKRRSDFWTDGSVPWLSPKDMGPDVLRRTQDTITNAAVEGSSVKLVPGGSVVVVVRSGILERKLPVGLVPFATTLNQDMKAVKPRSGVDPRWIAWGLRAFERDLLGQTRKDGTTVASIEWPRFQRFRLPVPSLVEQRRIVDLLEDHLSRLDAGDQLAAACRQRISRLRQAKWASVFASVGGRPRALTEVASIANGQTPKGLVEHVVCHGTADALPFYKIGDMNAADGRWMSGVRSLLPLDAVRRLRLHIRPAGTVLIPKRGGAIATNKKRILREPSCFDLNTMGLVPSEELDSSYLWHWLEGVDLTRLADGSNVPQINAPQIRALTLPIPSLDHQRAVVAELDGFHLELARLATSAERASMWSGRLRRSLLAAAFAGRLIGAGTHVRATAETVRT